MENKNSKPIVAGPNTQGDVGGEPSEKEVQSVLEALQRARAMSASPADTADLDVQAKDAQRLYNDRADRAEWLSLADRIGNALVRINAANAGLKSGVDMTKINYGPGYDASAAEQRAARDYEMSLKNIGQGRSDRTSAQKLEQDRLDREARALEPKYEFEKYKYGQKTDTYQQSLRDAEALKRREKELTSQEARDLSREKRLSKADQEREDKQLRSLQVTDLQKQIASAQSEAQAASQAAQILSGQKDLSKKNADKLMSSYPGIMAKAGITPEQMTAIQEQATEKGFLWDSVDEKKRQQLIQEQLIKPKQEQITNLRKALDGILGKGDSSPKSAAGAPAAAASESPSRLIRMRHKASGAERDLTEEEAAKLPPDEFERI
jgi:hypothetical protein